MAFDILQRFKSRRIRSPRVGDVRSPGTAGEDIRALGGVGAAAANLGIAFLRQEKAKAKELEVLDGNRELAIANGLVNKLLVADEELAKTTDDIEVLEKNWDTSEDTIQKHIGAMKNPLAIQSFTNTFNQKKALWRGASQSRINTITEDRSNSTSVSRAEEVAISDMSLDTAIENEIRQMIAFETGTTAELLSEQEVKAGKIQELINKTTLTQGQKDAHIKRLLSAVAGVESIRRTDAIYSDQTGLPYEKQRENVNKIDGITSAERNRVLARLANDEAIRKESWEIKQEGDRRGLYDAIMGNTYTPDMATVSSLDVDEQHKFDTWNEQRIDRLNKGIDVVTNNTAFSRLKDLAVAISDDRASRRVAQDALQEASAQGLIDDDDWTIVDNMIRTNYTTARKTAQSTARLIGGKQILGVELSSTGDMATDMRRDMALLTGALVT